MDTRKGFVYRMMVQYTDCVASILATEQQKFEITRCVTTVFLMILEHYACILLRRYGETVLVLWCEAI